ncbi:MAG TPA: hypothetical protein DCW29_01435 [Janthinobacterium sp.]|nr:hypothetical protein [Janthinobacterium sp.]
MSTSIASISASPPPLAPAAVNKPIPVAGTGNAGLASLAVSLSSEASVVATFGGSLTNLQVYSPQGLLNAILQAGTAPTPAAIPAVGSDATANAQQSQLSLDQAVVGTLSSATPAESGIYSSGGPVQSLSSEGVSAGWASILNVNPGAAGTVIADSFAQGILGSLQTSA